MVSGDMRGQVSRSRDQPVRTRVWTRSWRQRRIFSARSARGHLHPTPGAHMQRRKVLTHAGRLATSLAAPLAAGAARGAPPAVVERDVCVIGGGSAGTYTALRL